MENSQHEVAQAKERATAILFNSGMPSEQIKLAIPESSATTTTPPALATTPQIGLATIDGGELYDHEYPPRQTIVDGLIYRGDCIVVAGRPKCGKSWLCFQLAESIDSGKAFLGKATTRAKVLYMALEDGERRIHERLKVRNWRPRESSFAFGCLPFDVGEGMTQVFNGAAPFDVVIIDTLIATLTGKTDESNNTAMAEIMNALARWAHETEKALVIVHHAGKGASEDPFEMIRGASSIRGAYDMGIVLQRKAKEADAVLHVESRDIDAPDMTVKFDASKGWTYEGDGARYENLQAGRRVVGALLEMGDWQTADAIAEHLAISPQAARAQLLKAERIKLVERKPDPANQGKAKKPRDLWTLTDETTPTHN